MRSLERMEKLTLSSACSRLLREIDAALPESPIAVSCMWKGSEVTDRPPGLTEAAERIRQHVMSAPDPLADLIARARAQDLASCVKSVGPPPEAKRSLLRHHFGPEAVAYARGAVWVSRNVGEKPFTLDVVRHLHSLAMASSRVRAPGQWREIPVVLSRRIMD